MSREQYEMSEESHNNQFLPDWPFTESPPPPENPISDEELIEDFKPKYPELKKVRKW